MEIVVLLHNEINIAKWSAQLLDLNPIENLICQILHGTFKNKDALFQTGGNCLERHLQRGVVNSLKSMVDIQQF